MSASEKLLHIDIPVKLSNVKTVFSVGALAFEGDLPASIFHLQLIENDTADWQAKAEVIARQVAAEAPAKGGGPPGTFIDRRLCLPKEATMPRFYINFRNSHGRGAQGRGSA